MGGFIFNVLIMVMPFHATSSFNTAQRYTTVYNMLKLEKTQYDSVIIR